MPHPGTRPTTASLTLEDLIPSFNLPFDPGNAEVDQVQHEAGTYGLSDEEKIAKLMGNKPMLPVEMASPEATMQGGNLPPLSPPQIPMHRDNSSAILNMQDNAEAAHHAGSAELLHTGANAFDLINKTAKAIQDTTGLNHFDAFEHATKALRKAEQEQKKAAKEAEAELDGLDDKTERAVFRTPYSLAGMLPFMAAAGPVGGMAIKGALDGSDQGLEGAAMGAATGAVNGAIFHGMGQLPTAAGRVLGTAGATYATGMAGGASHEDALAEALAGSALAAPGQHEPVISNRMQREYGLTGGVPDVRHAIDQYAQQQGIKHDGIADYPHWDQDFAKRSADHFEQAQHAPHDPAVQASYNALKHDLNKQFRFLQEQGFTFTPYGDDTPNPYPTSVAMRKDLAQNKHLFVYTGGDMGGDHPLSQIDPATGMSYNWTLRAVHDVLGHGLGQEFGAQGERSAYLEHGKVFSPAAIPALTAETHLQNSWVNAGKHLRRPDGSLPVRGDADFVPPQNRPFAEQKAFIPGDDFVEYPKFREDMIEKFGKAIQPHLHELWAHAKHMMSDPNFASQAHAAMQGGNDGNQLAFLPLIAQLKNQPWRRQKVNEVGQQLEDYTQQSYPAKDGESGVKRFGRLARPEIEYQQGQPNSGKSWYESDIGEMERNVTAIHPELADPTKMGLFKSLVAITSNGQAPSANMQAANKIYEIYKQTGEFPQYQADGKGWSHRAEAVAQSVGLLNKLVKQFGEQGAVEFLLGKHLVKDLREMKTEGKGNGGIDGKQTDTRTGYRMFGPKIGNFALNIHGIQDELTADLWFTRTWNRMMGTMMDDEGDVVGAPRNGAERGQMVEALQKLSKKTGLDVSAIQALLWYYEKNLYDLMGASSKQESFSQVSSRMLQDHNAANAPMISIPSGKPGFGRQMPKGERRVSFEQAFGGGTPLAGAYADAYSNLLFPQRMQLMHETVGPVVDRVARLNGVTEKHRDSGPGIYENYPPQPAMFSSLSEQSPIDRVKNTDFMRDLGYVLQQEGVWGHMADPRGSSHAIDVVDESGLLKSPEQIMTLWEQLQQDPKLAKVFAGAQPIKTPKGIGIRMLNKDGIWTPEEMQILQTALGKIKGDHDFDVRDGRVDLRTVGNDWKENPNGEGYLQGRVGTGRPGVPQRSLDRISSVYAGELDKGIERETKRLQSGEAEEEAARASGAKSSHPAVDKKKKKK